MKKWITAPLLALALTLPVAVFAQATPAKLELARQVVALQKGSEQEALLGDMANAVASTMVQKWGVIAARDVSASKQQQVSEALDKELEKLYDGVYQLLKDASPKAEADELVNVYAAKFTEDQLKTMVAWFQSDAFKAYQAVAPEMADAYMRGILSRTSNKVQDLQGAFDAKAAAIISAAR